MNEKQQNLENPQNNKLDGTVVIKINHPSTSFSSMEFNCLTANNESKEVQQSTRKRKLDNESSAPKGCTLDKIPRIILVDCIKNQPQQTQESAAKGQRECVDLKINITCNDCQLNFSSLQKFLDHLNISVELEMKENIPPKEPKSSLSSTSFSVKSPSRRRRKKYTSNDCAEIKPKSSSSSKLKYEEKMTSESHPNPFSEIETKIKTEYSDDEETEINDDDFYSPSPENTDSDNDNDQDYDPLSLSSPPPKSSKSKRKERPRKDKEKKLVPKPLKGESESESGSNLSPEVICEKCGKILSGKMSLKRHVSNMHSSRPLDCPIESCPKSFATQSDLDLHILSGHSTDKVFKCPECPRTFKQRYFLKDHLITHTVPDGRPFKCPVENCTSAFNCKTNLWEHKKLKHPPPGEIPKLHKCTIPGCPKSFACKKFLRKHLKIHAGIRPFKCDVEGCGSRFTSKHHLAKHMTMHTGERPFKCQVENCGATFQTASHLKQHGSVHSKEFNHLCDLCGKSFKTIGGLSQHEVHVHRPTSEDPKPPSFTRPKKYPCENPGCGRSFTTLTRLTNHQKLHENDTSQMQLEYPPQQ